MDAKYFDWAFMKDYYEILQQGVGYKTVNLSEMDDIPDMLFEFLERNANTIDFLTCKQNIKADFAKWHRMLSIMGPRLREMSLFDITDIGSKEACNELGKIEMPRLTRLRISGNDYTEADCIHAIIDAKNLKKIEHNNFRPHNDLAGEGLAALMARTRLENISVQNIGDSIDITVVNTVFSGALIAMQATLTELTLIFLVLDDDHINCILGLKLKRLVLINCHFVIVEDSDPIINDTIKVLELHRMNTMKETIQKGLNKVLKGCHGASDICLNRVDFNEGTRTAMLDYMPRFTRFRRVGDHLTANTKMGFSFWQYIEMKHSKPEGETSEGDPASRPSSSRSLP